MIFDDLPDLNNLPDEVSEEGQDFYEHYGFTVDKGQSLLRIDKFLTAKIENVSRNRIQSAADAGCILVNGKAVKSNYKVKPLDSISIVMPYPRRGVDIVPENIPLNILHEDDDIIVINKPAGMVVHPGHGNYTGTLVNALAWHLGSDSNLDKNDERGGLLVHRIDKNTSGILLVAKNDIAHAKLAKQFFDHTVSRLYTALVWGRMEEEQGTVIGNIARSQTDRMRFKVYEDETIGKHAVTHYKVLEELGYVSLVECKLETGRTHQIRVHMEYLGHPLFNDERYGGDKILRGTTFTKYKQFVQNCFGIMPHHTLHARTLGFVHPTTGKEIMFEVDLPDNFKQLTEKWRTYIASREVEEEKEG